jgi:hypothetical protein
MVLLQCTTNKRAVFYNVLCTYNALLLSTTELHASLSALSAVAIREALDEVMCISSTGSLYNLSVSSTWLACSNVAADAAIEQHWLLTCYCNSVDGSSSDGMHCIVDTQHSAVMTCVWVVHYRTVVVQVVSVKPIDDHSFYNSSSNQKL